MGFLCVLQLQLPCRQVNLFGNFFVEDGCKFSVRKLDIVLHRFIRPYFDDQTASSILQFHVGLFHEVQCLHLLDRKSSLRHSIQHMMYNIALHADCLFRRKRLFVVEYILLSLFQGNERL